MADIKIYGTLKNGTDSGKIAYAAQIFDETENKFQSEINASVKNPLPPKLRVALWNVGHFALGANYDTTITHSDYETMKVKWRQAVNDINSDLFLCCEYNTNFVNAEGAEPAITARDAVWNGNIFKYAAIGTKPSPTSYMQTAIFSNLELSNVRQVVFPQTTQVGRYYQVADVTIGGRLVKVVSTHLDFDQGNTPEQQEQSHQNRISQINKLINDFASYPYVIIAADCNIKPADEADYELFTNAGYKMANCDYLRIKTYPAGDTQQGALDNIMVKGFIISGIKTVNDATLTDHFALYADLTMVLVEGEGE